MAVKIALGISPIITALAARMQASAPAVLRADSTKVRADSTLVTADQG